MRDEDKGADGVEMVKLLCTDELFHLAYNYCAWLLCSKRRSGMTMVTAHSPGNSLELEDLVCEAPGGFKTKDTRQPSVMAT